MKRYSRIMVALVGATVVMGALVGTASATRLSSSSQTFRATWSAMQFSNGILTVRCPVTLEGTLHSRTIAKTAGSLIGLITSAVVGEASCQNGIARANRETLPWHVKYRSFTGTLPSITAILVEVAGATFEVEGPFGICTWTRYSGTVNGQFNREAGGALTGVSVSGTVPKVAGDGCGENGTLSGTSNAPTVAGGATRITVTLI